MTAGALNPIGLSLAGTMSLMNVLTDVARKHALEKREINTVTFWTRIVVTAVFAIALAVHVVTGAPIVIRGGVPLFLAYLVLDVGLITLVMWLYFRALQVSPLSLCVPFLAFTPVFLLGTGFVMLHELPAAIKILGVVLIVVGSLVMHRKLFAEGWLAPVKAVINERGSRYMLLVSLIFSITNPLDKKLVLMSDVFTESLSYGLGLCLSFYFLGRFLGRGKFAEAVRGNLRWIALAGVLDGVSLLLQLASYSYIDVVIAVSIKRAGIILSVFSGWLFFRERGITDKVIAASVMFAGVLILYLPLTTTQALLMTGITLLAMSAALYATRNGATACSSSVSERSGAA
ncbi:MAG TPA: EamA family transporter [Bryobacteraceae bacterium]|nr:EamA family transporter [Bryobacteraceae bacterium]